MSLHGSGVLAIWNGMQPGREDAFLDWHVREHIPERIALPGFLRGRRYMAITGAPAYFNFYEVDSVKALQSDAYTDRLNNPTDWTKNVVADFTDTSRTLCMVEASKGQGDGGFIAPWRFDASPAGSSQELAKALDAALAVQGVCAAHLLTQYEANTVQQTAESKLRDRPDGTWPTILLIECVSASTNESLEQDAPLHEALTALGLGAPSLTGHYQLQYALDSHALTLGQNFEEERIFP